MTLLQKLKQAEKDNDWLKVKLYLVTLGLVKDMGYDGCPHCATPMTGIGVWPDMSSKDWIAFVNTHVSGYVYRCGKNNGGCGNLFVTRTRTSLPA